MTLNVIIIDDHPLVRAGVRHELSKYSEEVSVIGEAEDVDSGIALVREIGRASCRERV